ncbi:hypothetical protein CPJCM30710_23550 [Clostridium polyendosporum]|uniref:Uncharacterized protein n=1 Tax=Clostridium polyendosporum TaxID=69208 RepID=A0A919S1G2_9CLOT|nr:hypothetical protein [Clostridium polyendosporum]GIM29689.1 hypothetical protein CPJCM30710_23550 [Clostridium polyendosporum]
MNKKIRGFIVIFSTIISVVIMLKFGSLSHIEDNKNANISKKDVIQESEKEQEKVNVAEVPKVENDIEKHEKQNNNLVKKEESKKNINKVDKENTQRVYTDESEPSAPVVSIFKIEKDNISNKMSLENKAKLAYLSRKLSTIDYGKIQEYMNGKDEFKAATEIFKILKVRLQINEYEEVKNILRPYIDVDFIDNNI